MTAHNRLHRYKLTDADVERMRQLRKEGLLIRDLAIRFGVTERHVSAILLGVRRKGQES